MRDVCHGAKQDWHTVLPSLAAFLASEPGSHVLPAMFVPAKTAHLALAAAASSSKVSDHRFRSRLRFASFVSCGVVDQWCDPNARPVGHFLGALRPVANADDHRSKAALKRVIDGRIIG